MRRGSVHLSAHAKLRPALSVSHMSAMEAFPQTGVDGQQEALTNATKIWLLLKLDILALVSDSKQVKACTGTFSSYM